MIRCFLLLLPLACGCAVRHDTRGLVLKVDPADRTATVSHDAIPGYMDAMVMQFSADDPQVLTGVRPGDRIAFRINVHKGVTKMNRVKLLSAAPVDSGLLVSPALPSLATIGEPVPDFTLTDHRDDSISLSALRGKVVVITFIYTRCPLPDYCPRMIANLDALRRRFPGRLGKDLSLLAVTFDPKHDTQEKLRAYADHYRADVAGWHFLSGAAAEISRVCSLFGVEFWPEEGLISHTLQTAVVDRSGRLVATVEGQEYSARQLADLVGSALSSR